MTVDELLEASDRYEEERLRWTVRRNKANLPNSQFEVIQLPPSTEVISEDNVVIHLTCSVSEVAYHEMELMRGIAAMKAALG